MRSKRIRFAVPALALLLFLPMFLYASPSGSSIQSLVLAANESEFWTTAKNCGWNNNHVAIADMKVTSINYIAEVGVYSKDNKFLFYIPKEAMTRAVIKGYLQLAVYDRESRTTKMLEMIRISEIRDEKIPDDLIIDITLEMFRMETKKIGWNEYLVFRNEKQVNPVNIYKYNSVFTKDGVLLFNLARDQAEYARTTGFLSLAKMPDDKTIELAIKIPIKK